MSEPRPSQPSTCVEESTAPTSAGTEQALHTPVDASLERVLAQIDTRTSPAQSTPIEPFDERAPMASSVQQGLCAAWIEKWEGRGDLSVRLCPSGEIAQAELMRELDRSLVEDAARDRQLVLLDRHADRLLVIGVIATHKPKKLKLDADTIELLASRSLLLRVGRAALELRQDGNIEIVGSRISAASRGLFRLVGRMLRLN